MAFIYLIIAFTLNALANIFLKIGAQQGIQLKGLGVISLLTHNAIPLAGIILFGVNVMFYFLALRSLPISTTYPVMTIMSFFLINGFAYFYLNESINVAQLFGYALIIAGLILIFYFKSSVPS
ncbi:MAG: hypothetical protein UT55_C0007G0003 [Candidatus Peregrinibacteria bacterium GW2011_GWE2_39_6]|nr:MAG: hypothetical protein UT36_C0001G0133 [Candidatus Peregrinibacteria bacterium GW2011_GWF2_39_17]KKR26472.1 MAG: hypothetical protein UT55_C0007G0003 [Candidatus Peregrinibacteria bacterium GW2011_GWE2_39_6]HCW32571.1 hypothetical protein [Candidatus Peregrinibacteria bacterium]